MGCGCFFRPNASLTSQRSTYRHIDVLGDASEVDEDRWETSQERPEQKGTKKDEKEEDQAEGHGKEEEPHGVPTKEEHRRNLEMVVESLLSLLVRTKSTEDLSPTYESNYHTRRRRSPDYTLYPSLTSLAQPLTKRSHWAKMQPFSAL